MSKIGLMSFSGSVFNGPELVPSVEQIDRAFGATRPGSYDKHRHLFALNFRGLTFYFPVDLQYEPHYNHGLGSLRFPGDASPVLSKMLLYSGTESFNYIQLLQLYLFYILLYYSILFY